MHWVFILLNEHFSVNNHLNYVTGIQNKISLLSLTCDLFSVPVHNCFFWIRILKNVQKSFFLLDSNEVIPMNLSFIGTQE